MCLFQPPKKIKSHSSEALSSEMLLLLFLLNEAFVICFSAGSNQFTRPCFQAYLTVEGNQSSPTNAAFRAFVNARIGGCEVFRAFKAATKLLLKV